MIKTVADLRRALDAYPDDMPIVTPGNDGYGEYAISGPRLQSVAKQPVQADTWAGAISDDFAKVINDRGEYLVIR